ncbi:MAG: hypothetical protein HYS51_00855 [Candidatus Zambryskibacteria bacterium]|nr:hypothetical protein [Candidatus Zambryskibacteria bacterium]
MKKVILLSIVYLLLFTSAFAQGGATNPGDGSAVNPGPGTNGIHIKLDNPFGGGNSLFALLQTIINDILLPIGGVLAILAFIYSGFLYVTAQGNETKIKKAHQALLYTAIGTALLLGAWVFANAICGTIELISGNPNICPN